MAGEESEGKPKASIAMDDYGNAAREYIRARTAANSAAFFLNYLKPGMELLDCGCGEGTITVDLAALLAPGRVVGIDIASIAIERARQLATDRGLTNLRLEVGSVYELPFPDASFDAVFAHTLFEHLTDKSKALREIWRVLKPGGLIGLRAPDNGAMLIEPPDPLIDQYWQLFAKIRDELGGESQVGRRLSGLLRQAGFTRVIGTATFESYGDPERAQWFADIHSRFALDSPYAKEWLARGWVEHERLKRISAAWKTWAAQPDAFTAWAYCEAVGWKP
jgi:ubiquinone/menaquinone biosynthesis C-methylase UbiE